MAHRVGVCGSCRARYQIPSTFTPNRARCRTCGGVVEIGPPEGTPAPVPKARAEPRAPEVAPAAEVAAPPAPEPIATPTPEVGPKERSLLVPLLVAAGAIALLALGAWQLFGGKSAHPSADRVAPGAPAESPPR